ncbi:MAG: TonB-dependent receptor, partial [Muribaculaceae bacterium]|nr:TonB-dependent receptor [Muribaculaceae bacterium]
MNLRFLMPLCAGIIPLATYAAGDISGKVINKESGAPMDFATVQLVDANTGKPLPIGTNTDEDGAFILKGVKDGTYIVRVSNIGSVAQERQVNIKGGDISIGTIILADDTKLLQEVVVEGVRSQMRFELDRKVFTVDANVTAAGQSASELLESIPSVEVDQDGEVSLRGNSSVTVWINGKESGLTADNRAQILEQIPAETIDRIEVITNPSAKYSPEGTAGIINIVLKKDRKAGYYGSAEIGVNSRGGGNVGANVNFNSSKVDAYAGVGFRMRHAKGVSDKNRVFDDGTLTNSSGE